MTNVDEKKMDLEIDKQKDEIKGEVKEALFQNCIGQFGKWQFWVCILAASVKPQSAFCNFSILFLAPTTKFWCANFANDSTNIEVLNSTCYPNCIKYEYDASPFKNTIISEWDLVCDRQWLSSFTQTIFMFGVLVGSSGFGFVSDRYGRRKTVLIMVTILILFSMISPFSPNYWTFTCVRFVVGAANGGVMMTSFVICMEVTGQEYREIVGSLFQIPFNLGQACLPIFAYYFREWDTFLLSTSVTTLIFLSFFFLLPESPRWLLSVGRSEEATKVVTKAAKCNGLPVENISTAMETLVQQSSDRRKARKANYIDLFRTSELRIRTIASSLIWLITGLSFYGFNQYISQTSSNVFISSAAAGAIQLPATILSIFFNRRFGRKRTTFWSLCASGMFIISLGFVSNTWISFTIGIVGVSCLAVSFCTIYIYSSELFPTVVRAMGVGLSSTSSRIGAMIAPFVANLAVTAPWLPTAIMGIAPFVAALLCLLLPETQGQELAEYLPEDKRKENA